MIEMGRRCDWQEFIWKRYWAASWTDYYSPGELSTASLRNKITVSGAVLQDDAIQISEIVQTVASGLTHCNCLGAVDMTVVLVWTTMVRMSLYAS